MKEETRWKVLAGIVLITITLILMTIHFMVFHDSHHLFIYFLGDLAFVPVEVLCVTLIIDQMLESRERQQRIEKLNMVIGITLTRIGTPLLARLIPSDPDAQSLRQQMTGECAWSKERLLSVHECLQGHACRIDIARIDLESLRTLLIRNEDFLLRIIENPMVFEHESFTDLILAITHLAEELKARGDLTSLPPSDLAHLSGDIERVYSRLVPEWLRYMDYLQRSYPYLFSLAMRTNPFDNEAKVLVS